MFGGIKKFAMKQMIKRQVKNLPPEQRDRVMKAVTDNPEFFEKISKEIKNKVKHEGKDQMSASMEVMRKYQGEIQKILLGK